MSDGKKEYEIEKIYFHETVHNEIRYYVKWKKFNNNSNTWEPEKNLKNCAEILNRYKTEHNLLENQK